MKVLIAKVKRTAILNQVHRISGIVLSVFIGIHFMNHLAALGGPEVHIKIMEALRKAYRTPLIEFFLLLAVAIQIISGSRLIFRNKFWAANGFDKLQILSGFYLALFLLYHTGVVLVARTFWQVDTNFYFAAHGPANFPACLFFIPYYSLSIMAVFVHIACVHRSKVLTSLGNTNADRVAYIIMAIGLVVLALIMFTFSGGLYPI